MKKVFTPSLSEHPVFPFCAIDLYYCPKTIKNTLLGLTFPHDHELMDTGFF